MNRKYISLKWMARILKELSTAYKRNPQIPKQVKFFMLKKFGRKRTVQKSVIKRNHFCSALPKGRRTWIRTLMDIDYGLCDINIVIQVLRGLLIFHTFKFLLCIDIVSE